MSLGNVLDSQRQTRECPCVSGVSLGTKTNPRMSLRKRTTMRIFSSRDKPEKFRDKARDRISPSLRRDI
nr:MAG TPA: hypothetical protein [Caudoviricetes sp.]